jgi:IMP dehydrogenase/GMP reductase
MQQQFKVCLDVGNGHDSWVFELASKLKSIYGKQIILMGGNIENPESYVNYSKSGFDFVRIGMTSGSLVMKERFGFNYPMASLILDTCQVREKSKTVGIRPINIIVDGGISSFADITKCLALGADYVMMGRELVRILEAAGTVYDKKRSPEGIEKIDEILKSNDLSERELKDLNLVRLYSGNTTLDTQRIRGGYNNNSEITNPKVVDSKSIWVPVTRRLDSWLDDFKEHVRYSFMMSNSRSWKEFKNNIKYGKI